MTPEDIWDNLLKLFSAPIQPGDELSPTDLETRTHDLLNEVAEGHDLIDEPWEDDSRDASSSSPGVSSSNRADRRDFEDFWLANLYADDPYPPRSYRAHLERRIGGE